LIEVQKVSVEIKGKFSNVIGSTLVQLSNLECRLEECNLGNLIADAFVAYHIRSTRKLKRNWSSVPIAIINGGAIRTTIGTGNITMEHIVSASPFGNEVGVLQVNGSLLWKILQHSGAQHGLGGFMQVSGLRLVYDLSLPPHDRLVSVRVRCADCITPHYEDIDLSKTYAIAITEYLVSGGDNYTMIDPSDFSNEGVLDYDILSYYVNNYSPIFTGQEDRIVFISTDSTSSTTASTTTGNPNSSSKIDSTNVIVIISVYLIYLSTTFMSD